MNLPPHPALSPSEGGEGARLVRRRLDEGGRAGEGAVHGPNARFWNRGLAILTESDTSFLSMFRVIFHLDMDAFYASIEQRDNPSLRGKPVIVGSPPTQRGVVCAASYEARKFGVRSAMPSVTAGRLCPKGIFVRPRMEHYREESRNIMALVAHTGALIEQVSIDEVYLDLPEVAGQASRMAAARDATVTDGPAAPLNADEALYLAV